MVVALAAAGGGYGLGARTALALAALAAFMLAVSLGAWPRTSVPRAALLAGGALVLLTLLAAASTTWADSAERAFIEFDREVMYLAVLGAVILAARRGDVGRWADGLALGAALVATLALGQRCLPGAFPTDRLPEFLPGVVTRLSYPVGYWNGLAILVGLGLPLLLRSALEARRAAWRALALAPFPIVGSVIYLTSSRGGVAAAVSGLLVFLALTRSRVAACAGLGLGAIGVAGAVAVLHGRPDLVDGPLNSARAVSQGHSAGLLIGLLAVTTGALWGLLSGRRILALRIPRVATVVVAPLAAVAVISGVAALDPGQRLRDFRQPPLQPSGVDFVRSHLLSGTGSGRWQFWGAAVKEFESRPLVGRGAGSYEAWWAAHAPITYYIRDAHSLYLQTLGELGLIGSLALMTALATGVVAGVRRTRAGPGPERTGIAAVTGALVAFLVGAGLDWIWQLTAVGVIGVMALGLLVGSASLSGRTTPTPRSRRHGGKVHARMESDLQARPLRRGSSRAVAIAVLVLGIVLICAEALPWLTDQEIRASQRAARNGNLASARDHALDARALWPWASSPALQLALVDEAAGNLAQARRAIAEAIAHDHANWRLWLVSARLSVRAGDVLAARRALSRARALNPHSPLLGPAPPGR